MKKALFLAACVLVFSVSLTAQNNPQMASQPTSLVPTSPNAASLAKFAEFPVSGYSGIPDINVPVWQIETGDIRVPVSLSYHAGGIRVDEIASWVGTGWALSAGGTITRSTRGLVDSYQFYADVQEYYNNQMTTQEISDFVLGIYRGFVDAEPDIYYLNLGGISCKFFMGHDGNFKVMPRDINVKIEANVGGYDWIITDPQGISYKFLDKEFTETSAYHRIGTSNETSAGYSSDISSWNITEIEDIKGNKVNFYYTTSTYYFLNKATEKIRVPQTVAIQCQQENEFYHTQNTIIGKRLTSITYKNGEVIFSVNSTQRSDLPNDYALDQIEIKERGNSLKKFKLFTSYFTNNQVGTINNVFQLYSAMDYTRLRLDSLREEGVSEVLPAYKFSYYNTYGLPYRLSNAQDHWGYFNGEDNTMFVTYWAMPTTTRLGAEKSANGSFAMENTLTAITYPTGGTRNFEFEGNKFMTQDPTFTYSNQSLAYLTGNNSPSDLTFTFQQNVVIDNTILNGDSYVAVTPTVYTEGFDSSCSCSAEAYLEQAGSPSIHLVDGVPFNLAEGNYVLKIYITNEFAGNPFVYASVGLTGYVKQSAGLIEANGPGIRVKTITNQYGVGQSEIRRFEYTNPTTNVCSGQISNVPEYYSTISVATGSGWYPEYTCDFNVFSSSSNYPLLNTKSTYVGYSYVSEFRDTYGDLGKKVYEYTNYDAYNDINAQTALPYPPNSSQDWKRGLLLSETNYAKSGGVYVQKSKISKKYEVIPSSLYITYGVKVGAQVIRNYQANDAEIFAGLIQQVYPLHSDAFVVKSDTSITSESSGSLIDLTTYSYSEPYFQLISKNSIGSDQNNRVTSYLYPYQMVSNSRDPSGIYQAMLNNNMVDVLVEEVYYTNSTLSNLKRTNYNQPLTGVFLPETIDTRDLLSLQDETRFQFHAYDGLGNLLSMSAPNGPKTVYIWSYQGQYPVAEIKNAELSAVVAALGGQTAVDSFRDSSTPDVATFLGGLRAAFPQALITTYTYKPLVGMLSMTDPKGMTTTYEYDSFQRLMNIKDQNGNIVQSFDYQYKQ